MFLLECRQLFLVVRPSEALLVVSGGYGFEPKKQMPRPEDSKRDWLFQTFKYFMMSQEEVYNPLFSMVDISDFKNKNIRNVGVIAADIDMSQVEEYLPYMAEYRVPISAISNVRKVPYRGVNVPYV